MGWNRGGRVLGVVVLGLSLGACADTYTPEDRPGGVAESRATLPLAEGIQVIAVDADSVPTFVNGAFGQVPSSPDAVRGIQAEALAPVIARVAPLFRVKPEQLFLKKAYVGFDGDAHFRFGVRVNGVEVMGAELRLHARDGQVFAANGEARTDLPAPLGATRSPAMAGEVARTHGASPRDAVIAGAPALVYWRDGARLLLAYRLRVTGAAEDGGPVNDTVLVNARSGEVLLRYSNLHSLRSRRVYDGRNTSTLPGTMARAETPPSLDPIVNVTHDNLGAVYACYWELFGRDSFDNAGAPLIATVHHRVNYVNAFWTGTQLVFGDGDGVNAHNLALAVDVTAHELTHGVTEHESGLIYSGESGGMNESMSDIFGAVCEWHAENRTINAGTFLLGEDFWTPTHSGDALRYMSNPRLDGVSLDDYSNYTSVVDVHYSSGISNMAFYLLSQGGRHPSHPDWPFVEGIGIEKAARIFYKANMDMLTPSSGFLAARITTEQAAIQLGYDAGNVASVTAAWEAVNVRAPVIIDVAKDVPIPLRAPVGKSWLGRGMVPTGARDLKFTLSGGTGDADLYVRFGDQPTTTLYQCRPFRLGNNEQCIFPSPAAGAWHVLVHAASAYDGASLVMTHL
ncbi:M4 family metallopeptidase [Myxococcus sp. CA040A]|uniref:M4 family metallopeptidase n=1 Tax=Myxococcus sp. CA040A TaxID=2741738 RepID=UPI00157A84E2|nr:M4 family metallopeptidase [Myxococcus sp. CA040A]NTX04408.1 M4 family metallopeptidase [Myxococcus sp. CA040A]